ncbi:MAG: sigma-54 dependent transcriptional regulator [Deltaproteobacteria bacterium]
MNAQILLVDDEPNQLVTIERILGREGYLVSTARNARQALEKMNDTAFDLVVTDLNMPVMDGMALLHEIETLAIHPPVIVLTGFGTVQSAVEAMKHGAADYLIKPCDPDELKMVIARQLELGDLRREVAGLRRDLSRHQRFGELLGESPAMEEVYGVIESIAANKSTVLITGESGTGKELVARTIHQRSPWARQPFVALNCGAVSESLLDSQLFGHRRGAFTGAIADQEGVFQAAHGGTLFLDEISEIPGPLQAKFLRALQEREVTPIGMTHPIRIDVRILAATNQDLNDAVREGRFREDLFYRLHVVNVHLPPLAERGGDVLILATEFIRQYAKSYNVAAKELTDAARRHLLEHHWPGNVRELQNAIERAFALSRGESIDAADLGEHPASRLPGRPQNAVERRTTRIQPLENSEKELIEAALAEAGGNKNEAARLLGIDRQRLYRKISKYGVG